MILSGLALALLQEVQQSATPQAQFDAWVAGVPADVPQPLTQEFSWRLSFSAQGTANGSAAELTAFLTSLSCQGAIRIAIADHRRFKFELSAQIHAEPEGEEEVDFEGVLGVAVDGQILRAYAEAEPEDGADNVRVGAQIPMAAADRLLSAFRDYMLATADAADLPEKLRRQVKKLWPEDPQLMDLLHPRGYVFNSFLTTPVAAFQSVNGKRQIEFKPEMQLWDGFLAFDAAVSQAPELAAETRKRIIRGMHMGMTADTATGQPLSWEMRVELPLAPFQPESSDWIDCQIVIESNGFSLAEPGAAALAAPAGIEWIDGEPFIALALTQFKQLIDEAASAGDEEF